MNRAIEWLLSFVGAAILVQAGIGKFLATPGSVAVFEYLGMEPTGRIIIAVCEVVAGILLLVPRLRAMGGFLGLGVMIGAVIAHATRLGMAGSSGIAFALACITLVICAVLTYVNREHLLLIGRTMDNAE